jgi:hypothetical protein
VLVPSYPSWVHSFPSHLMWNPDTGWGIKTKTTLPLALNSLLIPLTSYDVPMKIPGLKQRRLYIPSYLSLTWCGVQGESMGAGRLLDLLLCRQSFLEMILAGAVVELRPRPITDERKERELGQGDTS